MTEAQLKLLSERLIKTSLQREAVKLHMIDDVSACEAERRIHGSKTATVGRDAKRVNELYEFCKSVVEK